jgi:hypothetical protein
VAAGPAAGKKKSPALAVKNQQITLLMMILLPWLKDQQAGQKAYELSGQ